MPPPRRYRFPTPGRPAIILLPGVYETWAFMLPVADALRAEGFDVHAVLDLGRTGGTIEDMAALADAYIRREDISRCLPVAHSKGGLIGKLLLSRCNAGGAIHGLVAINTPSAGFDPHILGGSHLGGAHNIQLETRGDFRPLADARVHEAVLEGIRHLTD